MTNHTIRTRCRKAPINSPAADPSEGPACNPLHDNLRLQTLYVAPTDLKPPERAVRKHSKPQLKQIEASISERGFIDPMLVTSEMQIVCGYARWLAASALGMELVPVIVVDHLSNEQLRLYAIAENKIAEQSEFDIDELRAELGELEEHGLDVTFSGFPTSELDDLFSVKINEAGHGSDEDEEGFEPQAAAITRPGDIYQFGAHRLICGNSLEKKTLDALMGHEKAGMVFSDAPYNLPAKAITGKGKSKFADFAMAAGEMSKAEFTEFLTTSFKRCVEFSKDGCIHFQCMDWKHMGEMLAAGEAAYTELKNLVVWSKHSAGMGAFYRSQHELLFVWKSGTAPHTNNFGLGQTGRYRTNVWQYKGNAGFHRERNEELAVHCTVKPWSMVADAIRDCSKRGEIVLDPFGGAGTTAIAAEKTGRMARLIELDPAYCDVIIRRWQKLTGMDAILAATGQTFSELERKRGLLEEGIKDVEDADDPDGGDDINVEDA